jgi:hypothetical protein
MFRGVLPNLLILVDQIMDISWFWFIGRIWTNTPYDYFDWCNNNLKVFKKLDTFCTPYNSILIIKKKIVSLIIMFFCLGFSMVHW